MKTSTILLDVDGVLLDTGKRIQEYLAKEYGVTENQDIFCWDWEYALGVEWRNNDVFWEWFWGEPLEEYQGAKEFVRNIQNRGFRACACSNRTYGPAREAAFRDFPAFGFDEIAIVDDPKEKLEWAIAWDADYSLEDNPKNAFLLGQKIRITTRADNTEGVFIRSEEIDYLKSFLLTRPWNSRCVDFRTHTWKRVDDYEDFLRRIDE